MQIRPATLQDVGTIQLLAARTWPVAYADILSARQVGYMLHSMYGTEVLTQQMQNGHQFWLAEDEQSSPIGFAGASAMAPPDWKLHKLYVMPFIQTKGVGKALLQTVADTARQAGATGLQLNVNRANKAVGFYQHLGFDIIGNGDFDIGAGFFMNDYIMRLAL